MKKLLVLSALFLAFGATVFAQQLPIYSNYVHNSYLVCPAFAGSDDFSPVNLTFRKQWTGLNTDGISTQVLSGHTRIEDYGVGGMVFNDSYGTTTFRGAKFTYAKHFKMNDDMKFGFGANISVNSFAIDQSEYHYFDSGDEALGEARESAFTPNVDFGAALFSSNFKVGLSVNQILETKLTFGTNVSENNTLVRHYYLLGAYTIEASDDLKVEPSLLVRYTERTTAQVDVNAMASYMDSYFIGLSWRSTRFLSAQAGVVYKNIVFGYAFDMSAGKLSNLSQATHELMLGYRFPLPESNSSAAF